jgi:hypothetical protein
MNVASRRRGVTRELGESIVDVGREVARLSSEHGQFDRQQRHALSHVVVELAGEADPLLLMSVDQLATQFAKFVLEPGSARSGIASTLVRDASGQHQVSPLMPAERNAAPFSRSSCDIKASVELTTGKLRPAHEESTVDDQKKVEEQKRCRTVESERGRVGMLQP